MPPVTARVCEKVVPMVAWFKEVVVICNGDRMRIEKALETLSDPTFVTSIVKLKVPERMGVPVIVALSTFCPEAPNN